jgi:hypothetical protein
MVMVPPFAPEDRASERTRSTLNPGPRGGASGSAGARRVADVVPRCLVAGEIGQHAGGEGSGGNP